MLQWVIANWSGLLAVVTGALSVAVLVLHLAHKDAVADKLQGIEDTISKIGK